MKLSAEILPGTLDMLILRVLARESLHGYGIAQRFRVFQKTCFRSARLRSTRPCSGSSSTTTSRRNGRRRRTIAAPAFYRLTPRGKKHLAAERAGFDRYVTAIHRVLQLA